ncbi:serine hydrolase domain-containing protein [Cellulomonas soli]|nr:serine hydrolase domain-containing protein [Cellulomonas soli]NYI58348.1 CubicO group peptidase (beta-lactamase class C family) [Cellulomonas soli]
MSTTTDTIRAAAGYLASWVEAQAAHQRVPGVQVAIRSEGELVLDLAVGVADVTTGEPLRTDHLFRIASHSKTFTATAILQLVEQGRLRLDDPVGSYVPELADGGSPVAAVTVRELLGHQGGVIRDGDQADFWQLEYPFPDRATLLADVLAHGHVHERNEHFKYSNVGYSLLGLVIEAVTGTTFAEHLHTAVVAPLGVTHTGAELDPARAGEYAAGHTGLLLGAVDRETIEHVDTRAMAAATGFYSTAADLTVYGSAHCLGDTRLLSDDSKRIMQRLESVVSQDDGTEIGRYGVGIELKTVGKRALVGHSGGYPGHITRTYIDPKAKLVVSVLTNAVDGPADQIAVGLLALVDLALNPPKATDTTSDTATADGDAETPAAEATTADPARFTGRFAGLMGLMDLTVLGGRPVIVHPTYPDPKAAHDELEVLDDDRLLLRAEASFGPAGEVVHLTRAEDGTITSVRVGGMTSWPLADFLARRSSMTRVAAPKVSA